MPTLELDRPTQTTEAPDHSMDDLITAAVVPQLGLMGQLSLPPVEQDGVHPGAPLELDFSRDFTPPVPDKIMAGFTTTRTDHPEGNYPDDAEPDD